MKDAEEFRKLFEYFMSIPAVNLTKEQQPIRLLFNKILELQSRIEYLEEVDRQNMEYPLER